MNYFCGSINPTGNWDIFSFNAGSKDDFYAHSKMEPDDIIVLVVGKQDKDIESGAYAILKCTSTIYKKEIAGKLRNRIEAECLYHSGSIPFMTRDELEHYVHLPIRIPISVTQDVTAFSHNISKFI